MCHWSYWCICRHKSLGQSNNWLARITVKASHFIYEGLSCVLPSANLGYSIAIFKYERGTSVRSNLPPPLFGGFNQPPRSILTICLQLYGSKALSLYHTVSLSLWLNCISTSLTPIYSVLIYLTSKNKPQLGSLTCSDFFFQISWILDTFGHVSSFFTHPMIHVATDLRLPTAWHRPSPWPLAPVPPWPFPTPTWSVGHWMAMIPSRMELNWIIWWSLE